MLGLAKLKPIKIKTALELRSIKSSLITVLLEENLKNHHEENIAPFFTCKFRNFRTEKTRQTTSKVEHKKRTLYVCRNAGIAK